MPAKEIKELRQSGKLEEALSLAKAELVADPDNIWPKRNLSWVYYDYLKLNSLPENFNAFISWLNEIKNLQLPADEKMLFEQMSWQIGKMAFSLMQTNPPDTNKSMRLFEAIQSFCFPKPYVGYSFLFKALHKLLKDTPSYLLFADWWDYKNFMPEDFQKEKMPNGKEVMAIAEQAYIAYTKHLLPKQSQHGEIIFNKEKAAAFLPILSKVVDDYPQFQYPAYFNAKLLLALGDKDNMLESLLPFAKKKRNDFWVWDILAEAFSKDADKVFACYCKSLSCKSPEEMLVSLRQKLAGLLIAKKLYNEARTEIDLLIQARNEHSYRIPNEVINWQSKDWYKNASSQKSNFGLYKEFIPAAESLLFSDTPEETVIVEFVNTDKKMLNFIASESKFGYFKYDRFLKDVKIGETLKVRFQGGIDEGMHQIYTAVKFEDLSFKAQFLKEVSGLVKIPTGKSFGFIDDIYIHPALVTKMKLTDGMQITANAIKTYNKDKKQWSWKLIS
ncbi:MAG: DUF7017 domain-containing protein [Bacteroidales bacterium]